MGCRRRSASGLPVWLVVCWIAWCVLPLAAADSGMGALVVLDNGREKPLETFAGGILHQFAGRSRVAGEGAVGFLTRLLFAPTSTLDDPLFLIQNPDTLAALGLTGEKRVRLSYAQLTGHLETLEKLALAAWNEEEQKRSPVAAEILQLYESVSRYSQLASTLRPFFPHPDFMVASSELRERLGLPGEALRFSLFDIFSKRELLQGMVASLAGRSESEWLEWEREASRLWRRLAEWVREPVSGGLALLPGVNAAGDRTWVSPREALLAGQSGHPATGGALDLLAAMCRAYHPAAPTSFRAEVNRFRQEVGRLVSDPGLERRIGRELFYNRLRPFTWALLACGLALLSVLLFLLAGWPSTYRVAFLALVAATLLQTAGFALRMGITGRPPVTNLYETFLFVAFMGVLLGLVLEWTARPPLGVLVGGVAGLAFLVVARAFSGGGDTMGMLVAVLDSNLWLTTHVVTISIGYSGVVVAGIIGHVVLLGELAGKRPGEDLLSSDRTLRTVLAFGLFFTVIGTLRGGIWADQSWGRFWGWDPKENGALVIILWVAVLLHARISGWIGPLGLAAGSLGGIVCVALAWLGVNLLGVGRHAYGFTSGVSQGLLILILIELLLMGVLPWLARRRGVGR